MQANLGLESVPATPGAQNINLMPYVVSPTEIVDTTSLPQAGAWNAGVFQALQVSPISVATDGTQIWKITHNGVDTHPIHFHAFDVQVINRVTWDNIVMPPDPNELGWKDTVRVSPLQDTIVALRPVVPGLPWDLPNSVRFLSPMMVANASLGPNLTNPAGDAVTIPNHLVNFGAEYVYHCHILSHEEMDMMRPVTLAYPPRVPVIVSVTGNTITWTDSSLSETAYAVERCQLGVCTEQNGSRTTRDLAVANTAGGQLSFAVSGPGTYRVVAENTVGDPLIYTPNPGNVPDFPVVTARSFSELVVIP